MEQGVQAPGPSELSPYQLVTIQFKVIRYLHSLIFLLPAPLPPASSQSEETLHTGDRDSVQGESPSWGAGSSIASIAHRAGDRGQREGGRAGLEVFREL